MEWYNYFAADLCTTGDDVFAGAPYRVPVPLPERKVVLFHDKSICDKLIIYDGNHHIDFLDENENTRIVERNVMSKLFIAHFPFRSKEQVMSKCIMGWIAFQHYQKNESDKTIIAWPWKMIYEFFVENNGNIDRELLYKFIIEKFADVKSLVYDPVRSDILLKYSALRKNRSLAVKLLKLHEDILAPFR